MKIATWNVNSVKPRLAHLCDWLKSAAPDVALLQEIKVVDEAFPALEIEDLGYNVAVHGQKSYNGVAILSKRPIEDIRRGLPGDDGDEQARYIEATVDGLRVASVYLPNGNPVDSEKFTY
ncbi:MAG TPA: exodeoxyribonuclease III, partial [Alphaproteobacteria bacterium]|nr:exodeoxyribonuclease III [Alphaproteobacteria bacterium]